jgi:ABC-type polysaccharide/polyol phosphate export permease
MTPVVYQPRLVFDKFTNHHLPFVLYLLNPMTAVVMAFQRAFYYHTNVPYFDRGQHHMVVSHVLIAFPLVWYFEALGILALVGLVLLWIGFNIFGRAEGNFAEEL